MDPQTFLYALDECTRENTDYSNLVEYIKKIKRTDFHFENTPGCLPRLWSFSAKQNGPLIWSNLNINWAELIYRGYLCPSREKRFWGFFVCSSFLFFVSSNAALYPPWKGKLSLLFRVVLLRHVLTYANMLFKVGLLR